MDQQRTPPRSRLGRLRDRVRSRLSATETVSATSETDAEAAEPSTDTNNRGNLFHCQQCGAVFIATEKEQCTQCETDVEQVRSTLSCR